MHRHRVPVLALAALSAAAVLAPAVACAQEPAPLVDTLTVQEGAARRTRPGVVESYDHDTFVVTVGGKKTTFAAADVVDVQWGDAPRSYENGMRALASNNGEEARRAFEEALREKEARTDLRPWIVEYANAGLGEAWYLLGIKDAANYDKATAAFTVARQANAKSPILDRILLGLGQASAAQKKYDAALEAATQLQTAARTAKRPLWEIEAVLFRAGVNEAKGNTAGATGDYDEVIRVADSHAASAKDESLRNRLQRSSVIAAVRKGWVIVDKAEKSKAAADFEAARGYFQGLSGKHGKDPRVAAATSNALGVIQFAAGNTKEALRQFQTTEVRHFAVPEEVARALFYQALCHEKLGNQEARADRVKDLVEYHPKSEWARKAQAQ